MGAAKFGEESKKEARPARLSSEKMPPSDPRLIDLNQTPELFRGQPEKAGITSRANQRSWSSNSPGDRPSAQ